MWDCLPQGSLRSDILFRWCESHDLIQEEVDCSTRRHQYYQCSRLNLRQAALTIFSQIRQATSSGIPFNLLHPIRHFVWCELLLTSGHCSCPVCTVDVELVQALCWVIYSHYFTIWAIAVSKSIQVSLKLCSNSSQHDPSFEPHSRSRPHGATSLRV